MHRRELDRCMNKWEKSPSRVSEVGLQDGTQVALLSFDMSSAGVAAASVQAAVLQLHVSAAGSGLNQFLVLGLRGVAGTQGSIRV